MAIIKSQLKIGQKIPKKAIETARKAAEGPITFTEDAPESTPETLKEFARARSERRKKESKQVVAVRLEPEVVDRYKSLGKGYTSVMADVLDYVSEHPEILYRAGKEKSPQG